MKIILSDTNSYVVLTEKGVNGINNAKKRRGDSWTICTGERVHIACRARYVDSKTIEQNLKQKNSNSDEGQPSPKKLRSSSSFEFKTCCLYCCQVITETKFRNHKASQVMSKNREFEKKVLEVCDKRNDAVAISVKGRIRFATDLHAAHAVYHTACDSSFRKGKNLPKKYSNNENLPSSGLGRPILSDRENVFQQMIEHLFANDEEQITLNDLKELIDSFLKDSSHEAFTTKWIKHILEDEIIITEINGKPSVVTFRKTAAKILQNFYNEQRFSDPTGEKESIILAAAKLLKTEIKEMKCCSESYPNSDEIESLEFCKQFIPPSLRLLLENIFTSTNKDLRVFDLFNSIKRDVFASFLHSFDLKNSTSKCFCCV